MVQDLKFLIFGLVYLSINVLKVKAGTYYVSTPEVMDSLGIQVPQGTIEAPFTSIPQTIFNLSEGDSHEIYISQDYHQLDSLECQNCKDQCEIFRGGNP